MEKLNWKRILIFGLPILFALSLAITLAACMAEAGRGVGDSVFDEEAANSNGLPTVSVPEEEYSKGLEYSSNGDGTCTLSGLGECQDEEVYIPTKSPSGDTVTEIGMSAFLGNRTVKRIILPDSIKTIGYYAFYDSSIEEITVPSGVETIGDGAFSSCRSLKSISVESGNTKYASLDGVLLSKDKARLICYPSGKTDKSYTVRLGVTVIESAAFLNCEYLETVKYNGQKKDWDKIRIGANNTSLTSLEIKFLTSVK